MVKTWDKKRISKEKKRKKEDKEEKADTLEELLSQGIKTQKNLLAFSHFQKARRTGDQISEFWPQAPSLTNHPVALLHMEKLI